MDTWKVIPFAPAYEACADGRIRRIQTGHVMTPVVNIWGYPVVCMRIDGKNFNGRVHRVIARTFLGESPLEVNHINGVKADNRIENLEYVSRKANAEHASKNNLYKRGSAVRTSKLKESDIAAMWAMRDEGHTLKQIGERFGVRMSMVSMILRGDWWRKESEALGRIAPRSH